MFVVHSMLLQNWTQVLLFLLVKLRRLSKLTVEKKTESDCTLFNCWLAFFQPIISRNLFLRLCSIVISCLLSLVCLSFFILSWGRWLVSFRRRFLALFRIFGCHFIFPCKCCKLLGVNGRSKKKRPNLRLLASFMISFKAAVSLTMAIRMVIVDFRLNKVLNKSIPVYGRSTA